MNAAAPVVAEGVWKEFRRGRRADTLGEALPAMVRALARRARPEERFWALQDVSFEVHPGRVLGIIGANGAGKSTMLKLLMRVIGPTRGTVAVQGRVGALVELAAGFHPDLTGRENLFLQGAIMGMPRRDVLRQFDQIVEFAEVGAFIDMPVKRYSSGMHARLGFAVAAHLSPDVLLVDEVLAVGDHRFQRRAFQRLKELVVSGAAVVVVSHQLERVVEFAHDAILLAGGTVAMRGRPELCVQAYIEGAHAVDAGGDTAPFVIEALTAGQDGAIPAGGRLSLVLDGRVTSGESAADGVVGVRVWALPEERVLFATNTGAHGQALPADGPFRLGIDLHMNLGPGLYRVQGVVWRKSDGSEWLRGESVVVRVEASADSRGSTFLAPVLRLLER